MPIAMFQAKLREFIAPLLIFLPEERLRAILMLAIQGILAGQSPLITRMAVGVSRAQL